MISSVLYTTNKHHIVACGGIEKTMFLFSLAGHLINCYFANKLYIQPPKHGGPYKIMMDHQQLGEVVMGENYSIDSAELTLKMMQDELNGRGSRHRRF